MRRILSGVDQLDSVARVLQGKRVGLMTNQTGIDRHFRSTIDLIHARFQLTALFAVEHGIRGNVQAGEAYAVQPDPATGVPVYAVYGGNHRLTPEMLSAFDVLCFDMQDVGARFYTYLYALSFAMEECARAGKPVVVLDRLNPLGGEKIEGPVLDERLASYVGMYALPTRYGLTIGEYARWVKHHLGLDDLDLIVAPLKGWRRQDLLDAIDIPWVAPSPNCPTFHAALAYVGTCIFEGTNLSEGRGTTLPFEYIGAPWIDAPALEKRMAARPLPGLHFRAAYFTPTFSKHAGVACGGVQVHITDRARANVVEGALCLLDAVRALYPDRVEFISLAEGSYTIDKLLGTDQYRLGVYDGPALLAAHADARAAFAEERRPFLLYPNDDGSR
ncbi:MAG: DUF1343 domain-containing protein [Clostridia bacterium]|nr:DUF1343 domain-containing protein [Clostridia bacterium]